jgi:acetyl esterase/lipase
MFARTLVFALALTVSAHSQGVTHDIAYTAGQAADLYTPAGPGPFPAIVYIHGGSWRSGNKSDFRKLAADLAQKGYLGFSIDYDLSPHSFPTSWLQAQAAIRFLRAHASKYHLNPDQIVVAGTSAGGELAALIALAPDGPQSAQNGLQATPVAGAIVLNGVFDLSSDAHVITRYLGANCADIPPTCRDASPIQHLHSGAPPFFVGHGTADHTVPYSEATSFIAALKQAGIPVAPYVAENGPHSYWSKSSYYLPNLAAVQAFLETLFTSTNPGGRGLEPSSARR